MVSLARGLNLVSGWLILSVYGASVFSSVELFLAIVANFAVFSTFQMDSALVRFRQENLPEVLASKINTSIIHFTILACLSTCSLALLFLWGNPNLAPMITLIILMTIFNLLSINSRIGVSEKVFSLVYSIGPIVVVGTILFSGIVDTNASYILYVHSVGYSVSILTALMFFENRHFIAQGFKRLITLDSFDRRITSYAVSMFPLSAGMTLTLSAPRLVSSASEEVLYQVAIICKLLIVVQLVMQVKKWAWQVDQLQSGLIDLAGSFRASGKIGFFCVASVALIFVFYELLLKFLLVDFTPHTAVFLPIALGFILRAMQLSFHPIFQLKNRIFEYGCVVLFPVLALTVGVLNWPHSTNLIFVLWALAFLDMASLAYAAVRGKFINATK
jgi:O-antigen/teichoic acid export membrane protein